MIRFGVRAEWIDKPAANLQKTKLRLVPRIYKDNLDYVPDPLLPRVQGLERIGFKNVDFCSKHGIFAIRRPQRERAEAVGIDGFENQKTART